MGCGHCLAAGATNCSPWMRGAFGWAHGEPGLEKAQGYCHLRWWCLSSLRTHVCILLCCSSRVAELLSRTVLAGSLPRAFPCSPAFLPPHHRDFLKPVLRNELLTQSQQAQLFVWTAYVPILPAFSPAFPGFPVERPAAQMLDPSSR